MTPRTQSSALSWELMRSTLLEAASSPDRKDEVAELIAGLLGCFVHSHDFSKYFRIWEASGFHVTPVHFYSPIPNTAELGADVWEKETALPGIDLDESNQLKMLATFRRFQEEYNSFPFEPTDRAGEFYLNNPMFGGTDALALYFMVRHFRPATIIEVGSGFSTRVLVWIRRTAQESVRTTPTCNGAMWWENVPLVIQDDRADSHSSSRR
jgi:hypothetical protein